MNDQRVPVIFKDRNATVYNALEWENLKISIANPGFTPVEIKGFYILGLILEICESVDCLLKTNSLLGNSHPLAYQVFESGGRHLPAFGIFASGVELLGRCLTGNKTTDVNKNLKVGFYYLAKPDPAPLLDNIPIEIDVVNTTSQSYSIQDLIDLRNYAAHGQSTVSEKDASGKKIPKNNLSGIERELFGKLPHKMGQAIDVYWMALVNDEEHCRRLAEARIDPYNNRSTPLKHVIAYFGQIPHQSAGSLFSRFNWET